MQSWQPPKVTSVNVMFSLPAAGKEAPQWDSTTSKHMLDLDRKTVVAGYVCTVMHVSIPQTRIRCMPKALLLPHEEGAIRQFCAELLASTTGTCTCTHMHAYTRGPLLLDNFAAFFMIPPLHRKWFSIPYNQTLKIAQGFNSNDKSNLMKRDRFNLEACCLAYLCDCMVWKFHWPCVCCTVLSRFGNWWPADKNQFQPGWVGAK